MRQCEYCGCKIFLSNEDEFENDDNGINRHMDFRKCLRELKWKIEDLESSIQRIRYGDEY